MVICCCLCGHLRNNFYTVMISAEAVMGSVVYLLFQVVNHLLYSHLLLSHSLYLLPKERMAAH